MTLQTCLEKPVEGVLGKCGFKSCGRLAVGSGLYVPQNQTLGLCMDHIQVAHGNNKILRDLKCPLKV